RLEMGSVIVEQARWPNGCLGFDLPRQGCAAIAFSDGYRLVMAVYGNLFEIHGIASSPGDFRLDPAQDSALIAIKDLRDQGIKLSTIKIDSSVLKYENDTIYFDVVLSSGGRQWVYTIDYWKKEITERSPK
ncbi:MAG TPA: hypothetical protein VD913_04130, partial [bacterium]|nr:hypothetical protein [bacterium]